MIWWLVSGYLIPYGRYDVVFTSWPFISLTMAFTWKLPAVGFMAATYWQSLMFWTVSFVVVYLNARFGGSGSAKGYYRQSALSPKDILSKDIIGNGHDWQRVRLPTGVTANGYYKRVRVLPKGFPQGYFLPKDIKAARSRTSKSDLPER